VLFRSANILAAVIIADRYGITAESMRETLRAFKGIEHRIEFVRTLKGVTFYNDSKGTNVDSVRWALLGIKAGIHLIAGGRDKAGDFTALNDLVREKVKGVYAIGEAAAKVQKAWQGITRVNMNTGMEDAVKCAFGAAKPGETVLLSPACASFDMYRNYEERGRDYKKIVGAL
jgi:UDP-N-acetylmuramoylalanine--D-glutamate ligase